MGLKKNTDQKLYFSISEVAQMFHVNESTLRFWEKEFDNIRPRKTAKGTRFYKQEDIEAVRLIYYLVKEKGMTLAGARQRLKDNKETTIKQADIVNRLKQIKEELIDLREAFDLIDPAGE
ncbi:MAG: MerR family transcriptional regulator [Tannerellaceae bacterium]|nr:MerR family transcriptional regulator [Tannerellaceae bacterium]MCD8178211.1 MerR family transcriptional regulator [Tannerellaceae bacterium]